MSPQQGAGREGTQQQEQSPLKRNRARNKRRNIEKRGTKSVTTMTRAAQTKEKQRKQQAKTATTEKTPKKTTRRPTEEATTTTQQRKETRRQITCDISLMEMMIQRMKAQVKKNSPIVQEPHIQQSWTCCNQFLCHFWWGVDSDRLSSGWYNHDPNRVSNRTNCWNLFKITVTNMSNCSTFTVASSLVCTSPLSSPSSDFLASSWSPTRQN